MFFDTQEKSPCNSLATILPIIFFKSDPSENNNLNHEMPACVTTALQCLSREAPFQKNKVTLFHICTCTWRWLKWFCFWLAHMLFLKAKTLKTFQLCTLNCASLYISDWINLTAFWTHISTDKWVCSLNSPPKQPRERNQHFQGRIHHILK